VAFDTPYDVVFPVGSHATNLSGPTATELTVPIHGIRPFRFAFLDNFTADISTPQLHLFARHGLPDPLPPSALEALRQSVHVAPALPGGLTVTQRSKTIVTLAGDFTESHRFSVAVTANSGVRDGFGLGLVASAGAYGTADRPPFVTLPSGFNVIADAHTTPAITAIARGRRTEPHTADPSPPPCEGGRLRARRLSARGLATAAALQLSGGCTNHSLVEAFWGAASGVSVAELGPQRLSAVPETWSFPDGLIKPGAVAYVLQDAVEAPWQQGKNCSAEPYSNRCSFFTASTLSVVTFTTAQRVLVWVTTAAAKGVSVTVVDRFGADVATASTDSSGLVSFTPPRRSSKYLPDNAFDFLVVAELGGDVQIVQGSSDFASDVPSDLVVSADVVFARGLYRAGETIHAVVLVHAHTALGVPTSIPPDTAVLVAPSWHGDPVAAETADPSLGTFVANLSIPATAQSGDFFVSVNIMSSGAGPWATSATITIADPRLPSGILNVTSPNTVFRPSTNSLPLLLTTSSYLGEDVRNATLDIGWTVTVSNDNPAAKSFSGQGVTSLASGAGTYTLSLPPAAASFLTATTDLYVLAVTVTWLDAARDLLQQTVTLPVQASAWKLTVTTSIDPSSIVPGNPFQTSVVLHAPGANLTDVPTVTVSLSPCAPGLERYPADRESVVTLTSSDGGTFSATRIDILPSVGTFCLSAYTIDPHGTRVEALLHLGATAQEWQQSPLTGIPVLDPHIDGKMYTVGDTVTMTWLSPFDSGSALLLWGHMAPGSSAANGALQVARYTVSGRGPLNFTFAIGAECAHGCSAILVVNSARGSRRSPLPGVVASKVYDGSLPETYFTSTALGIPMQSEKVQVAVGVSVPSEARPGDTVSLRLNLSIEDADQPISGTVALWVVDKALLDLLPHDLPPEFSVQEPFSFPPLHGSVTSSVDGLTSKGVLNVTAKSVLWRDEHDPWAVQQWSTTPCFSNLDQPDTSWLSSMASTLTYGGGYIGADTSGLNAGGVCPTGPGGGGGGGPPAPGPPPAPSPPPPPAPPPGPGPSPPTPPGPPGPPQPPLPPHGGGGGVHIRSNMQATAVFLPAVRTESDGTAKINFKLPDNLGTWVVKAVAAARPSASGNVVYGSATADFVVRKPLNLLPSLPRIVRVGDTFWGACTVTSLEDGVATVSVHLGACGGFLTLTSAPSQTVTVTANEPVEVLFQFVSSGVGAANVSFAARLKSTADISDGFLYTLPLLGQQDAVALVSSFAVECTNGTRRWPDAVALPAAQPGSGTVGISVTVGHLSGIQAASESIGKSVDAELAQQGWNWADTLVAALVPPVAARKYEPITRGILLKMNQTLATLVAYTSDEGLQRMPLDKIMWQPYPTVAPNWEVLYVVQRLLGARFYFAALQPLLQDPAVVEAASKWTAAIVAAVSDAYSQLQKYGCPSGESIESCWDWESVAAVRLALGCNWTAPETLPPALINLLSCDAAVERAHTLSVGGQATLVLAIVESNMLPRYTAVAKGLVTAWYDCLRVQGSTAYISACDGSATSAGLRVNTLVLTVLSRAVSLGYATDPLVEKLANYVAGPTLVGNQQFYSFNPLDAAFAGVALADFDGATHSQNPQLGVKAVTSVGTTLLAASFNATSSHAPVSVQDPYAELGDPTHPHALAFWASGHGTASFGLRIGFVPMFTYTEPVFFGLYVEKSLTHLPGPLGERGEPANLSQPLAPGTVLQVRVQVTAEDDAPSGIIVEDWLPAALQAQDPNLPRLALASAAPRGSVATGYPGPSGFDPYTWWPNDPEMWGFQTTQVFPDRVRCVTPYAAAGTLSCSYRVEVVTSGDRFVLPPAHAYVVGQPGIMGLSAAANFSVGAR